MKRGTERFDKTAKESKRSYSAPRLTDHGSLSKLTLGGSNLGNDGNTKCTGNANPSTQCNPS
jgi:hypothetical protein